MPDIARLMEFSSTALQIKLSISVFVAFSRRESNSKLPLDSGDSTVMVIMRIFHNRKQTLVEDNMRSAFIKIDAFACYYPFRTFHCNNMEWMSLFAIHSSNHKLASLDEPLF
jgi:hypothetical protein